MLRFLHKAQQSIAASRARFKVLRCGRRFGKTTYAIEEMVAACLFAPGPVAYFATTRDQARDIVWDELVGKVSNSTNFVSTNESRLEVVLKRPDGSTNKIRLFGWENIETARGKHYSLVVLDELDSMRAFDKHWREILRPTLVDFEGSALFMGTPKGYKSLYKLEMLARTNEDYEAFHFTSYDNPHLKKSELDGMKSEMTASQYSQEMLAEYKKMEGLIYEEFDRTKHVVKRAFEPSRWAISIDFGYNHPLAAIVYAIGSDDSVHVERMLYRSKLDDAQRAREIGKLIADIKLDVQVADSEDPIAIMNLNRELGLKLKPAVKGKGSVVAGINLVKSLFDKDRLTIDPDPSTEDLIWELENYAWKLAKDDSPTDEPVKENDDAADSMRYLITELFGQAKSSSRVMVI